MAILRTTVLFTAGFGILAMAGCSGGGSSNPFSSLRWPWARDAAPAVQQPLAPLTTLAPVAQKETVFQVQLTQAAQQDYRGQYSSDAQNKAFAVSPSGAFGVAFEAASEQEASRAALEKCMQDVRKGDLECALYDVNGRPSLQLPVQLRRIQ